ncbi:MAG TPA: hypothetical protein VGJ20_33415 [Xanthobacteraceae bacterium]
MAPSRAAVEGFHRAALAAGGKDEGPVGPRGFWPNAYAGYCRDLDGNKLAAYCIKPEKSVTAGDAGRCDKMSVAPGLRPVAAFGDKRSVGDAKDLCRADLRDQHALIAPVAEIPAVPR